MGCSEILTDLVKFIVSICFACEFTTQLMQQRTCSIARVHVCSAAQSIPAQHCIAQSVRAFYAHQTLLPSGFVQEGVFYRD